MDNPELKQEALKLSDRLAIERTILASDRSLLAWVRTSLSLIGFGFTIYKVLQYLLEQNAATMLRAQTPRNVGLFLILTGTIPLLLAVIGYRHTWKRLHRQMGVVAPSLLWNPNFLAASLVGLLGSALVIVVVLRIRLL